MDQEVNLVEITLILILSLAGIKIMQITLLFNEVSLDCPDDFIRMFGESIDN
jgi:hypothetical protein